MPIDELPRLHHAFARLPGGIKFEPQDFVVEEIPAYLPSGSGEHLYLWVEKRDLSAEQLLRHLARATEVAQSDIGCAGMKDRRAVTRQWISLPAKAADRVSAIESDLVTVLDQSLHGNKLRTGHLKGNRFSILVRNPEPEAGFDKNHWEHLQPLLQALRQLGFPNYYGDQRFGRAGETLQLGLDLLLGRATPKSIPYSRRRFLLKLSLSAVQSHLFNLVLAARIRDALSATVLAGDVMEVIPTGGVFVCEDPVVDQARCNSHEIALTGPLYGPKMKSPLGVPAQREAEVLESEQLTIDQFSAFRDLLPGARRVMFIYPDELSAAVESEGIRVEFSLPAGVYATTLLNEIFDLSRTDGTSEL